MQREAQSLVELGLAVTIAMVVIIGVLIPVVQDSLVTSTTSVTNETLSSSGTTPEDLTLADAPDGVVDNNNLVVFAFEATTSTTTKLPSANVTVLADSTAEDLRITAGADVINSTDDTYNVTYDGKPDGYIDSATARTIVDLLPVMLAVSAFVAAMLLVRG